MMSLLVQLLGERIEELKDFIERSAVRNHSVHHQKYGSNWQVCPMDSCRSALGMLEKDEG